jgi:hypothetical protein
MSSVWSATIPLEPAVLVLEWLEPPRLAHLHAAELALPAVAGVGGDPVPADHLADVASPIRLLQDRVICSSP